jgi:hypothetical protein
MMWPFKKNRTRTHPDENTADRRRAMLEQRAKLRRAHRLKERSAKVAAILEEENAVNHYVLRLREAYARGD